MKPIRPSAKAVIIEDGKLLCIKFANPDGFHYGLPGGGMEPGESIPEALQRECLEEIGAEVIVHDLRFVRDYIGRNHEFAEHHGDVHQIELMFTCSLVPGSECKPGIVPDVSQIGVEWLPLDQLQNYVVYPQALMPYLAQMPDNAGPVYIGDVN